MTQFKNDEEQYQAWLRLHPDGFVLNMRKTPSARYVVLHRATCSSISAYTRKTPRGAFTERGYMKVCAANAASLREWIQSRFGRDATFSSVRCRCKPEA